MTQMSFNDSLNKKKKKKKTLKNVCVKDLKIINQNHTHTHPPTNNLVDLWWQEIQTNQKQK